MSQVCYGVECCGEEHHIQILGGRLWLCEHQGQSEEDQMADKAMEALGAEVAPCFLFKRIVEKNPYLLANDPYLLKFYDEYQRYYATGAVFQDIPRFKIWRIC